MEVHVDANPAPQISWFTAGQPISPSTKHNISYDNGIVILLIANVQPQDSGDYVMRARNDLGEVTSKTILHVRRKSINYRLIIKINRVINITYLILKLTINN